MASPGRPLNHARDVRAVNKLQIYKQIREELAAHYEKELRNVDALLKSGCETVTGANGRLFCAKTESLIAGGEANKVFREELSEAVRLILERYQRALRREVSALGLTKDDPPWNAEEEILSSQATRSNGHAGHDTH